MATIVLAHGAWSAAWAWKKMRPLFAAAGHQFFSPTYTGLGERAHLSHHEIDLTTHINDVAAVLDCEDLKDVTLLGHSYGGMVATGVADKARRRIARVVYIDAFAPQDGQSLFDLRGAAGHRATCAARRWAKGRAGASRPSRCRPIPRPRTSPGRCRAGARSRSRPSSRSCSLASREPPLPRAYIYAKRSGPGDPFRQFAERAKGDSSWKYYEMDASHNPHITCPQELMTMLTRIMAET